VITNAVLISYTSPAAPDGRGGKTPGVTTIYPTGIRCGVDNSERAQKIAGANDLTGIEAMLFVAQSLTPAPLENGYVTFRVDGDHTDQLLQVARCKTFSHRAQSHFELALRDQ